MSEQNVPGDLLPVRQAARSTPRAGFVQAHTNPALTFWLPQASSASDGFKGTLDGDNQENPGLSGQRNRIAWLEKKGALFGNIISVGRNPINDICLPYSTTSKIHAVFMQIGHDWRVVDRGSRNGIFVNGERVPTNGQQSLADGDILNFSREIAATFYSPGALHDDLTS